jgi:FKBP-type peptidyl-prolyl cis-trans isomerase FkpA
MKRMILLPMFAIAIATFTGCDKTPENCVEVTTKAPEDEVATLETYLSEQGITAQKDERGFFYKISEPGNDKKPQSCSNISVIYKGSLTNGVVFDEATDPFALSLKMSIKGWQASLPLIGEGGKMTVWIPPTLAYGSAPPNRDIPPNAILIFDIELKEVLKNNL